MLSLSVIVQLAVVFSTINLSQNKKLDCIIRLDDDKVVYGKAGHKLECQLEQIDTDLYSVHVNTDNTNWLKYDTIVEVITGLPEKDHVGSSNVSITIHPKSCPSSVPWKVTVIFIIEIPTVSRMSDPCTSKPKVYRPVDHILATAGEVFKIYLDLMTFIDKDDGNTSDLTISLKDLFNGQLSESFWLKLDQTSLVLYGVPLRNDLSMDVINLVATDKCKQNAVDSIRLEVKEYYETYNHEFKVYFGDNNQAGVDVYRFIYGLVQWLDISDPGQIYVSDVDLIGQSISWVNRSIETNVCNKPDILNLYHRMADKNGTVLEEFRCFFSPFFNVSKVHLDFKDLCNVSDTFVQSISYDSNSSTADDLYLFYILIPVAILTLVILIIIIILLARKCMKSNKFVMNSEKPTFLMDRQPVIFQNEYNDEDTSLKPQIPVIIDHVDADPSSGVEGLQGRRPTNPPSYALQSYTNPPQYRLPPPYNISGV